MFQKFLFPCFQGKNTLFASNELCQFIRINFWATLIVEQCVAARISLFTKIYSKLGILTELYLKQRNHEINKNFIVEKCFLYWKDFSFVTI